MSASDFSLTSHEVMRGIKVRDGRLRLRPSGLVLFGSALDGIVGGVVAVIADSVFVRSRWRRRRIPITDLGVASVESVEWMFRQPVYIFVAWWPGREWSIGVIRTSDGQRLQCDALISAPRADAGDPTPPEMKVAALNRWVAASL